MSRSYANTQTCHSRMTAVKRMFTHSLTTSVLRFLIILSLVLPDLELWRQKRRLPYQLRNLLKTATTSSSHITKYRRLHTQNLK